PVSYLSHVDLLGVLAGRGAIGGEDGGAVAVRVTVDECNGVVHAVHRHCKQDWPEDLLLTRGAHRYVRQDGGADEVSLLVAEHHDAPAVEQQLGPLLDPALDEVADALLGLGRNDRPQVGPRLMAGVHLQLPGPLHQLGDPVLGLAHEDCRRERHAPLARGAKRGARQLVQGVLLVGIRHHDPMVLGSLARGDPYHVALNPLSILGATFFDLTLPNIQQTHKRDGPDVRMVTDELDSCKNENTPTVVRAVDDVHHSVGNPSLLEQLHQHHRAAWIALRRLEDHGVPTDQGQREHLGADPLAKRDHGREVERGDARGDSERNAVRHGVHVLGDGWQRLAELQRRHSAGVLHHLCKSETQPTKHSLTQSTQNVPFRVGERLALLLRHVGRQSFLDGRKWRMPCHVFSDELLQLEHRLLAGEDGRLRPGTEGLLGRTNGLVHFSVGALGNTCDQLIFTHRVFEIHPFRGLGFDKLPVDEHFCKLTNTTNTHYCGRISTCQEPANGLKANLKCIE
ncbi:unnamed protein product, partial [Ixodes persulcatus]